MRSTSGCSRRRVQSAGKSISHSCAPQNGSAWARKRCSSVVPLRGLPRMNTGRSKGCAASCGYRTRSSAQQAVLAALRSAYIERVRSAPSDQPKCCRRIRWV